MIRILLSILVALCFNAGFGQKQMILSRIGQTNHIVFTPGDPIRLKAGVDKNRVSGQIEFLTDSLIGIGPKFSMPVLDITAVRKDIYFPKLVRRVTILAGVTFLTIDIINNLINKQQVFDPTFVILSASLVGVGLVMIPLEHRYVPIGLKWKLTVMDIPVPQFR